MDALMNNWELLTTIITFVVALTPTQNDNGVWGRVINVFAKVPALYRLIKK